jgi:glyceraldehyde 3-phosphate dehydrogenase
MSIKVAINGFGRMGRLALRVLIDSDNDLEITAINERAGTAECAAHLLQFDSVHGIWNHEVGSSDEAIEIDGASVPFSNSDTLEDLTWLDHDCDIVLECTGAYRTPGVLQSYFDWGVKKVIVACPVKEGALNVVYGVNDHEYDPEKHDLLTAASCTTNCLAPVVKVVHEQIGIKHGVITTIHDITNTQTIVDAPHKDLRRARANNQSLIPTSTGSATAITMIYPELKGKLNGLAVRVPLLNASLTDCVFELEREVTVEEVNAYFKEASETYLKGILGYEERPLVSVDYKDDVRSGIIDAPSTMVVDGTSLKVLAWYDNEIGYVNRMVEFATKVGNLL